MRIRWRFESEGELRSSDNLQWLLIMTIVVLAVAGSLLLVWLKLGAQIMIWLR